LEVPQDLGGEFVQYSERRREMMMTSKKQNGTITGETTGEVTKKSGKGNSHGVVSEVSAYLKILSEGLDQ
jgi:hypothetical protein